MDVLESAGGVLGTVTLAHLAPIEALLELLSPCRRTRDVPLVPRGVHLGNETEIIDRLDHRHP